MGVALASLYRAFADFEPRSSWYEGISAQIRREIACVCTSFLPCPCQTNSNHNMFASSCESFLTFACGLLGKESRAIRVVHVDLCFYVSVWSEAEDGPPPGFSRSWSWAWCSWTLFKLCEERRGIYCIVSESWSQTEMQQIGKADNEPCKAIFWMAGGPRCLAMCFLPTFPEEVSSM